MKCSLCGAELVNGNNTCPSCGALNMAFMQTAQDVPNQSNTSVMDSNNQVEIPQMNSAAPVQTSAPVQTAVPTQTEEIETLETLDAPTQAAPAEQSLPAVAQVESKEGEVIDSSHDGFVDLDEGEAEEVHASEDMAAPTLNVNEENLTSTAQDISSSANVSTYDPTQEIPQDEENIDLPKESSINFTLPEVKDAEADTQGMDIMTLETKGETVGEESAPVKEKFSLKILKKKSLPRNFVFILLGVTLVIGILMGSVLFGSKVYTPGSVSTNKKTTSIPHVADGKNNTTYNGKFIYKIPQQYDFDKSNGGVVIYGPEDEYKMYIKALKGSYDKIANAKESIKKTLEHNEIKVNNIFETTVGENGYIVIQASKGIYNRLYAFRTVNDDYLFYVEIITANKNYDTSILEIANDIINNVEYNDKYTTMETIEDEDVSTLVVTTAEARYNA